MDVLYKLEKATVADVLGELPDKGNYSTVRAQLRVLDKKGMVQHEAKNMQYVYAPTVPREIARRSALRL
jgi:predicted transcriptional regulator